MNVFSLLDKTARRYATQPAISHGKKLVRDWAGLHDRALRLAAALRAEVPSGSRVAVVAKNCPEYPEILFAIWAAGLVAVPINVKLHEREIAQILMDSGTGLVFATGDSAALSEALVREDHPYRMVEIGSADYEALLNAQPAPPADTAPEALAWLFYTSGTTGRSKGAMLSHRNLTAMTIAHLGDFESLRPEDSILHAAPMSHGSGLYILPYVARGARQIVPASGSFDPAEFLDLCEAHANVGAFLAPTMIRRLRVEAERSGRRPKGLRSILYGGGPMYLDEIKKSLATFGPVFQQLYGQGESPMTITALTRADHEGADDATLSSVGWTRSGVEVAVVDASGRPLPPGEIGEIVCRGDVVMSGYWNKPEATAAAFLDGWLLTGDMGFMDESGRLTLRDRSKDVIISGGSNIYPREVEDVLLSCPGVAEASVLGARDAEWGEIVVAFVVRDLRSEPVDEAALNAHCQTHIARFKRPKRYIFVPELPKNSNGKVLKRELVQLLNDNS
jgi:acyl-CoA synthetase (AMP-forming)/AMP-acid ligase II